MWLLAHIPWVAIYLPFICIYARAFWWQNWYCLFWCIKIFVVYLYQIDCYLCTIFFFTSLGIKADIFFPVRWLYEMTWFLGDKNDWHFVVLVTLSLYFASQAFTLIWHHCLHYLFFFKTLTQGDIGGKNYYLWRW